MSRRTDMPTATPKDAQQATIEKKLFEYMNSTETDKGLLLRALHQCQSGPIYMREFLTVLENHSGFTSPEEEFIIDILVLAAAGRLSPQRAKEAVSEFEGNLRLMTERAAHFPRRRPTLLEELTEESKCSE